MTTYNDTVSETGTATEVGKFGWAHFINESISATEFMHRFFGDTVSELISANSTYLDKRLLAEVINENLTATTTFIGGVKFLALIVELTKATSVSSRSLTYNNIVSENVNANDDVYRLLSVIINELITATDSTSPLRNFLITLQEKINSQDSLYSIFNSLNALSETVRATDFIQRYLGFSLSDTISATDTFNNVLKYLLPMSENIVAIDNAIRGFIVVVSANELASATDDLTSIQLFKELISEHIYLSIAIESEDGFYTFVANTKTLGLSEYSGYNFNSLSEGLACNSDGIYDLNDADSSEEVNAIIRTGVMDFDTSFNKRVTHMYLGLTNKGEIIAKTLTSQNGIKKERWYKLNPLTTQTSTRRIQTAKGVKSRYWQFEIINKDGADFTLTDFEVLPMVLKRRI